MFEDGTKALVPLRAGRHLAAQHSDAYSSMDWAEDVWPLCGFVGGGRDDAQKRKTHPNKHMIKHKCE